MKKVIRVNSVQDAKDTEKFVYEGLKPGGFLKRRYPIHSLKDRLAWLSWANLRRSEQPTFVVKENNKIIGGVFGEPVETCFDKGESEIQDLFFKPEKESHELITKLLKKVLDFYKKNKAKQAHFWILEKDFNKNKYELWEQIAIDTFGFSFKGFRKVSKWTGQPICKIEKYF